MAQNATRNSRYGVRTGGSRHPAEPDVMLWVVSSWRSTTAMSTRSGDARVAERPAAGRWPGLEPADVFAPEGEGPALLADVDPDEAADLAAWAELLGSAREDS